MNENIRAGRTANQSFPPSVRKYIPCVVAGGWLLAQVLIVLFFAVGLFSYLGETISIFTCFALIMDIFTVFAEGQFEKLFVSLVRMILGLVYFITFIRLVIRMIKSIHLFKLVVTPKEEIQKKRNALLSLNAIFGKAFSSIISFIILFGMFCQSDFSGKAQATVIIGIVTFLLTGVLLRYNQAKKPPLLRVFVETLRDAAVATVVLLLCSTLCVPVFENMYFGIRSLIVSFSRGVLTSPQAIMFAVYSYFLHDLLLMIVVFLCMEVTGQIAGNTNYFKKNRRGDPCIRRFRQFMIWGIVLAAVQYGISTACGMGNVAWGSDMRRLYLPVVLLSIAGLLVFCFKYPDKNLNFRFGFKFERKRSAKADDAEEMGVQAQALAMAFDSEGAVTEAIDALCSDFESDGNQSV